MTGDMLLERIAWLERVIAALPEGSLATKTVHGRVYHYRRWQEGGKRHEKYVPAVEVEALREALEKRRALEVELRSARELVDARGVLDAGPDRAGFETNVRVGNKLWAFTVPVSNYKKRALFAELHDYVYGPPSDKVLVLYGLRRTGKTTMIRQLIGEMGEDDLARSAFIQVTPRDTLASLNRDLDRLEERGYRYVFVDEVTLLEDFVDGAALFADVFAASGMKVVLCGTDSLGFLLSADGQLYDRCVMLHTTFIPYREFEGVLGVRGIDEYIRYGGTMSLSGTNYNEASTFADERSAGEYVDSSIARNIQRSLRCYQSAGHFRSLQGLYEAGELTSAINRVVEDVNHRFTLEVLERDFRSSDLAISARNLRRDRDAPDVLDRVDVPAVTERLRALLEIRNQDERCVALSEACCGEIREYLDLLDLTVEIGVGALPSGASLPGRTVIAQPGLRYAQAKALVESLLLDPAMADLSAGERACVLERVLNEVKGRMMEDIVLLETKLAFPHKRVFALQFAVGEFDMAVFDPRGPSCEIYEVKHSAEAMPQQYRHLVDPQKRALTEHRYGSITGTYVLYRGEPRVEGEVRYLNVEDYLRGLG